MYEIKTSEVFKTSEVLINIILLNLGMVLVLKSSKDIGRIKEMLANQEQPKKFDAKKFNGAIKKGEDGLEVQRRLRNEWQ